MTRAEFLGGLLATAVVPALRSDRRADGSPHVSVIQDTPVTIRLDDFVPHGEGMSTEGFLAFVAAINASRGAQVIGIVPAGTYRLDSARLLQMPPVIGRDGVTIRGEGKPTIQIVGTAALPALIRFRNCAGRVEGIAFVGNNCGSGYTNGSAIQFLVDSDATGSSAFIEIVDCDFDNFRSTSWNYAYVSHRSFGIDRVLIEGNSVKSRSGNSIAPAELGMRAAAFLLQSKVGPSDGGGGIRNVRIAGNIIDARHIKTGIFLSDKVQNCTVAGNRVIDAGLEGARDNTGGYAFAAYDSDGLGMRDINFTDNVIDGVRSAGIYCAGIADVTIDRLTGQGQIDVADATLPKGLVVLNGVSRFTVHTVVADAIGDAAVCIIASPGGTIGDIRHITASRSRIGVYLVSAFGTSSIEVEGLRARECLYGILGNLVAGGNAKRWTLTRFDIVSAVPGSVGVRIFSESENPVYPVLRIGGNSEIATRHAGVVVSRLRADNIAVDGITFSGPFASAGVEADGATGLALDHLAFEDQAATGYAMRLAGARGSIGRSIAFRNVAPGRDVFGIDRVQPGAMISR